MLPRMARMVHLEPLSRDRVAERDARFQRMAMGLAGIRIVAGGYWLVHLRHRLPPDFGRTRADGLLRDLQTGAEHGLQPFAWLADQVLVPYDRTTGWVMFAMQAAAGVLLVVGYRTTLGAALGTALAVIDAALLAPAPGAWHGGFVLLLAVNVVLLLAPSELRWSVDATAGRV
jgi:uncharacterized membrane protein YphA (DoxX/SURF4 family)